MLWYDQCPSDVPARIHPLNNSGGCSANFPGSGIVVPSKDRCCTAGKYLGPIRTEVEAMVESVQRKQVDACCNAASGIDSMLRDPFS